MVLQPLAEHPQRSGLCLDFDGTLSPIVEDPAAARPLPEVPGLLARLAERFSLVVVISGRPVAFLHQVLGATPGVRLYGLYGLEWMEADGRRSATPEAMRWESVMAEVTVLAQAEAPPGVLVEPKGLTVTLHWRHAPEARSWIEEFAAGQIAERGVQSHRSGLSLELGPALPIDKGTVAAALVQGLSAVAAFGDDWGDLPVFDALGALATTGVSVARVAIVHSESPPEVAAAADLTVEGATGAVDLLQRLLAAAS